MPLCPLRWWQFHSHTPGDLCVLLLLYSQHTEDSLAHSRCSVNTCWMIWGSKAVLLREQEKWFSDYEVVMFTFGFSIAFKVHVWSLSILILGEEPGTILAPYHFWFPLGGWRIEDLNRLLSLQERKMAGEQGVSLPSVAFYGLVLAKCSLMSKATNRFC